MKKLLIVLGICGLIVAGCSKIPETTENWAATQQNKELTYENKQYPLKLDFPWSRTFKENVYGATVMFFVPKQGETTENLAITIKLINSWSNLETLYQENKTMLQEITENLVIENEKEIKVDYYPAKQIVYTFSQEDYKIKQEQILVIKGETLYMINYTATQDTFDEYKKDVDKIIKSISIR